MKKFILIYLLLGSVSVHAGEWITDQDANCQVWNGNPSPGESIKWTGQCVAGKATGAGTLQWYLNGKPGGRYEGEYLNGQKNGKGVNTFSNGNRYEGDWVNGQPNGKGVFTFSNGCRTKATGWMVNSMVSEFIFLKIITT